MTGSIRVFVPDGEFGSSHYLRGDYVLGVSAGSGGYLAPNGAWCAVEISFADIPAIIAQLQAVYDTPEYQDQYQRSMGLMPLGGSDEDDDDDL